MTAVVTTFPSIQSHIRECVTLTRNKRSHRCQVSGDHPNIHLLRSSIRSIIYIYLNRREIIEIYLKAK